MDKQWSECINCGKTDAECNSEFAIYGKTCCVKCNHILLAED